MDNDKEAGSTDLAEQKTKLENDKQQLTEQLLLLYQHLHEKDVKLAQLQVEKDGLASELSKERNFKADRISQQAIKIGRLRLELTRLQCKPLQTNVPAVEEIATCAVESARETVSKTNERNTQNFGKLLFIQNLLAYLRGLRADSVQLKFDVREKLAELNSGLTDGLVLIRSLRKRKGRQTDGESYQKKAKKTQLAFHETTHPLDSKKLVKEEVMDDQWETGNVKENEKLEVGEFEY